MRANIIGSLAFVGALALSGISSANATDYLANGSFETSDFTGWVQGGDTSLTSVTNQIYSGSTGAENGNYYVLEGPSSPGALSQTFSDVAGQTLQIGGWVIDNGNGGPAEVQFLFDGSVVLTINMATNPPAADTWTYYSVDVTATGSDTFELSFYNEPSFNGLDNFSVTNIAATPLPAAFPLFAGGLGLIGMIGRRKKRKTLAV